MTLRDLIFGQRPKTPQEHPAGSVLGTITTRFDVISCSGVDATNIIKDQPRNVTPIILGNLRGFELLEDLSADMRPTEEILRRANAFDFDAWIDWAREHAREVAMETGEPYPPLGQFVPEPLAMDAIAMATTSPLSGQRFREMYIGLIPTTDPTEVPAHFDFGNWNACPEAEVHIGLMRRWRDQFGARLIALSGDSAVFHVVRPPMTEDEAFDLAEQHFAYCPDSVEQGHGTLGALAGSLLGSHTWYFWWD